MLKAALPDSEKFESIMDILQQAGTDPEDFVRRNMGCFVLGGLSQSTELKYLEFIFNVSDGQIIYGDIEDLRGVKL